MLSLKQRILKDRVTIDKIANLEEPYTKIAAGLNLTVFPKVYHSGTDTSLICDKIEISGGEKALDLCTGNGLIALKMKELGASSVTAVDISPEAVKNAIFNSKNLGLEIEVFEGDLFQPVLNECFDIITMNPPFTNMKPSSPVEMMFWDDNYKVNTQFFSQLSDHLNTEGRVYLAWSSFADKKLLLNLSEKNGFNIKKIGSRVGKSAFTYFVYLITKKT